MRKVLCASGPAHSMMEVSDGMKHIIYFRIARVARIARVELKYRIIPIKRPCPNKRPSMFFPIIPHVAPNKRPPCTCD